MTTTGSSALKAVRWTYPTVPWKSRFVAWDTETTGLGKQARIVEIGSAAFSSGTVIATTSRLYNPCLSDAEWSSDEVRSACSVNGISREECERSGPIELDHDLLKRLFYCDLRFTRSRRLTRQSNARGPVDADPGPSNSRCPRIARVYEIAPYVAHNSRFDLKMLQTEWHRKRRPYETCADWFALHEVAHLCTIGLDLALRPDAKGHSLAATCERWGVKHENRHRALGDALTVGRLLLAMVPELPDDYRETWIMQYDALERDAERRAKRT